MKSKDYTKNSQLFKEANLYLVGGVNSPVRSFAYAGVEPLLIEKAIGSKVYDYQGKEFIDYVSCFGAMILGHAQSRVIEAVKSQAEQGFCFGTTHESEVRLSRIITRAIAAIEKIRFVSSGTESLMSAVRLARGYTKRKKIVKFRNSYHGHADYLLTESGSGLSTSNIPLSKGVPVDFVKHTLVVDYGDRAALGNIFQQYPDEIAAVLVEPVGGNYGVTPPNIEFLRYLRSITEQHGALFVADEVITGFRFCFGSFLENIGINPDLICLGKIIGGGLPIGAYGGNGKIMDHLAPQGDVYQASTFGGSPMVMQAGIATLEVLDQAQGYKRINELAEYFCHSIKSYPDLEIKYFGSMFSFKFSDKALFRLFYKAMHEEGIYFAPSEYEANFVSLAHSQADIEKTIKSVRKALVNFKRQKVVNG